MGFGKLNGQHVDGWAVVKFLNGKNFIGQFKNCKRDGIGYCTFCDRCYYYGMYVNDKKVDGSVFKLADDSLVYEGLWENDFYHGEGSLRLLCG